MPHRTRNEDENDACIELVTVGSVKSSQSGWRLPVRPRLTGSREIVPSCQCMPAQIIIKTLECGEGTTPRRGANPRWHGRDGVYNLIQPPYIVRFLRTVGWIADLKGYPAQTHL